MSDAAVSVDSFLRVSRQWLRDRFPLGGVLRAEGYSGSKFREDALAGATVALVSIPQAIGFALIAGLPPRMVIMSVIVGGFIGALFASSRHLVFGPTNSVSIIMAATIASMSTNRLTGPQLAVLLAVLIGLFQLIAGVAQLGKLTQFISRSVVVAYGSAIGILLIAGQVPHLVGMEAVRAQFLPGLWLALQHLVHGEFNPYGITMGVFTLLLFDMFERKIKKIPAELLGLVVIALLTRYLGLHELGIRTIQDDGMLKAALPSFVGLPLGGENLELVPQMLSVALAIAILGMLEAISIAKTLAAKSGQHVDPNQELVAMGLANVASSAFGAMPGSASFARSSCNFQSGARTQIAAVSSSLIVLGSLMFVAPIINDIPVPALAAHLMRIGIKMIHKDQIRIAWRATRSDAVVFAVTLAAAFLLKLDVAIYVGVGVSLALFLRKASAPSLVEYGFNETGHLAEIEQGEQRRNPAISIVHVEGELFFGAADLFQEQVRYLADDPLIRVVVLRMKNARHLDATSVISLLGLHDYLHGNGRHLLVSGIAPDVERVLKASGAWDKIGADNIFPAESNLTMSTRKALLRASFLLQQSGERAKADVRIFYDRNREKVATASGGPSEADAGQPEDYAI